MSKVLLVEDDPFLVDIYRTKFQEAGFDIIVVEDGDKAIWKIQEERPDVLVLDIVLPHKNGWEVLKTVKSKEELKDIKVLILSNLGQKEEVEKGMQLGADAYLIKADWTPSQVVEETSKLLNHGNR